MASIGCQGQQTKSLPKSWFFFSFLFFLRQEAFFNYELNRVFCFIDAACSNGFEEDCNEDMHHIVRRAISYVNNNNSNNNNNNNNNDSNYSNNEEFLLRHIY